MLGLVTHWTGYKVPQLQLQLPPLQLNLRVWLLLQLQVLKFSFTLSCLVVHYGSGPHFSWGWGVGGGGGVYHREEYDRVGNATTLPRQRLLLQYYKTVFAVATPFRHRDLNSYLIYSGPCGSITVRCRIVVVVKISNCRVPSSGVWYRKLEIARPAILYTAGRMLLQVRCW